jgi:hypothetical protein
LRVIELLQGKSFFIGNFIENEKFVMDLRVVLNTGSMRRLTV